MEKWKDNHLSAILEYPFDFERYIEERLREISDFDERQYAKKILAEGLGKLIQCTESRYRNLEKRVYEELEIGANQYETVLTVVNRNNYDPTNLTLYPVVEEDLQVEILVEKLSNENLMWLGTIYLRVSEQEQRRFEQIQSFAGTLDYGEEKQDTEFYIQPAKRYRNIMEKVYRVFQDNHIPWETINTAYLDKFYDVYTVVQEKGTVTLENAAIIFDEFESAVCYGQVPLWNMEWVKFDSGDFMLPSMNDIYYEHEFTLEDKSDGDGYLIETNEDILEIRHEKKKIVMKSPKETFESWRVLHIIQKETIHSLDYDTPMITNHKNDSFIRRFAENSRTMLMTKTDLFRRIMELDIRDYIEVIGYEICSNVRDYKTVESMNWFVRDELFPMESRKVMLLKFKEKEPGNYLNESMVRFVISQIQLEISEFRCVGVII